MFGGLIYVNDGRATLADLSPMRQLLAIAMLVIAGPALAGEEEMTGDAAAGLDYARTHCAECHAVEGEAERSPLDEAPTFREIANTRGMSELALVSFFQTDHPTMPNFVVPAASVRDLIAYVRTLKE